MPTLPQELKVSFDRLKAFIQEALTKLGLPDSDAMTVAALMAEADLQGSDGHGVSRLPQYARRIRAGGFNVRPNIHVVREQASTALLNGDNGMGHLVMKRAAGIAIEKARKTGIAWVNSQYSNHAGPASLYATMPLAHDMIGLYFAVGNANHLPPWGGLDMLLSTNPIAAAIPAGDEKPIVLDMATTVAAYGKVKTKALRGETMPEGWMIDREGKPTPPWMAPPIPPVAGGPLPMWPYRDLHNFSTVAGQVDPALMVVVPGWTGYEPTTLHIILEWADPPSAPNDADPWGGSADDYDLYLYDAGLMRIVASSTIAQNGNQDPREQIDFTNVGHSDSTYHIVINHLDTLPQIHPPKLLGMYISGCKSVQYFTPQNSIWGQPGLTDVIAVGAVPWNNSTVIEPFSSTGNYDVYLPAFASRPKPDVLGVDGVSISGVGGSFLPPFYGTSAAAPHVAALAALLLSKCPQMTPGQVQAKFQRTALPLTVSIPDPTYGYGFADIQRAMLEVNTSVGQTNLYTMNNSTNVPMFYATDVGYAMNTVTITGGAQQPTTVKSRVVVTVGNPYTDASVQDLGCPTINRWFALTQNGGISGGYNAQITAYIDESERSSAGVAINNLRILHWNGTLFDILPQAAAPVQVRNTWVIKGTNTNASFSPFFIAYLTRGVAVSALGGNIGMNDSTVGVSFAIQNTGNGWDSVNVRVMDSHSWTISLHDSSFSLGHGTSSDINIDVTVSHADTVGTIDTIWCIGKSVSDSTLKDTAFVTVKITSSTRSIAFHLNEGWNMVSVPLITDDRCRMTLYPYCQSKAFTYDAGYVPRDTLEYCVGYWIKSDSARDITYHGLGRSIDTIDVKSQWNMIGSVSQGIDIDSIIQIPGNIVTSPYYAFSGTYTLADSLQPGSAYWVRTNHIGQLILKGVPPPSMRPQSRRINPLASLNSLKFSAPDGSTQTIYFGRNDIIGERYQNYDLPPVPPEGSLDVRYNSQRLLESYDATSMNTILAIDIQASSYPLTVTGNVADKRITADLITGNNGRNHLSPGTPVTLEAEKHIQLVIENQGFGQAEKTFALEEAYPNPFNPSATIRYQLPTESKVSLIIFDLFGQVIQVLKEDIEDAGVNEVEWNGSNFASGIYFYKLVATSTTDPSRNFTQVRKMVLTK